MISENVTFPCNTETLIGTIDYNAALDKPTVLSLHGGGTGGRDRIAWLTTQLAAQGQSCFRFDHSGQGESSGELKKSSLQKRTDEALAAAQFIDRNKPTVLIASSMGGAVALEMLQYLDVSTLILFCPALYAAEAFAVPFDDGFTDIIRRENNFLDADLTALQSFTGDFLHIIGERDEIIPPGVTELYKTHTNRARRREFITLPDAPHPLHVWLQKQDIERRHLSQRIDSFIKRLDPRRRGDIIGNDPVHHPDPIRA